MRDLIADLDGTVIACGRYYSAACEDVVSLIVESLEGAAALDRKLVRELIDYLDVWAIRANPTDGFRRQRFPISLGAAVMAAQAIIADTVKPTMATMAYERGMEVFDLEKTPYEPFDGAIDTLRAYRAAGWRVWLYTKGDAEVQSAKVFKHGLDAVVDGFQVVPRKNPEMLRTFCESRGVDAATAVYVGDSARDDMQSARALGMKAVRVGTSEIDNWVHERIDDPWSDAVIASLKDLPSVVPL